MHITTAKLPNRSSPCGHGYTGQCPQRTCLPHSRCVGEQRGHHDKLGHAPGLQELWRNVIIMMLLLLAVCNVTLSKWQARDVERAAIHARM
jgi:hypothetical protein